MVTLKAYRSVVRKARTYPVPKRKPARLTGEAARAGAHAKRKSKSRSIK